MRYGRRRLALHRPLRLLSPHAPTLLALPLSLLSILPAVPPRNNKDDRLINGRKRPQMN